MLRVYILLIFVADFFFFFCLNIFYWPIEAIQDCYTWLRSEKKVSDACGVMVWIQWWGIGVNLVDRARKCHKTSACNLVVAYWCYRDLIYCCCRPSKYKTPVQHLYNAGPKSWTLDNHCANATRVPVPTGKCIKSYTRIILEKHKTMIKCQANAGPTLKAVCHLCGSIGPMSSVSRYLLWQCGNAISHTMAHVNRDPSKHETPKQC